jgi:hypothetical protein
MNLIGLSAEKEKMARGSAQLIEKARFGQAESRKSNRIRWISFGGFG